MGSSGGALASTGPGATRATADVTMIAAAVCVGLGVLAQISYPLLNGTSLTTATVASVVLLAGAAVAHASAWAGLRTGIAVLVTAAGVGLLAEALGTHTGYPFGDYSYATDGRLGPHLLGVPVVVPLAWTMLAYPAVLLARRLSRHRGARALLGAGTLTGWDLFLDPQMVAAGHWAWQHPSPSLPGVPDVPLTNFAGWLVVGVVLVAVLDRVLPELSPNGVPAAATNAVREAVPTGVPEAVPTGVPKAVPTGVPEAVPAAVLAWTWLGSTLGNVAFFDRPWVALYGFVGMGLFVAPYLRDLFARNVIRSAIRPGVPR